MKKITQFGFDPPLRASGLPALLRCPWRATLMYLDLFRDESGKAADTGSLTHIAVEAWHKDKDVEAALARMAESLSDFPLGDPDDARINFERYTEDPRNQEAEVVYCEQRLTLELPPHEEDPTGLPVLIRGTCDQIRNCDGLLKVFDVKTGTLEGWDMVHEYAYQMAAYSLAATETLKQPIHPGAFIRTKGYRKRGVKSQDSPDGVFFWVPYNLEDCSFLLEFVTFTVAKIRKGEPWIQGGAHCRWCPAGGIETCLPEYRRLSIGG